MCARASVCVCACATHWRACRRGQRTQLSVDRPTGARRLFHCEIFRMWRECFSAKQDCCSASFLLYFRGWFVCLFVKTVLFLPHFILFGTDVIPTLRAQGTCVFSLFQLAFGLLRDWTEGAFPFFFFLFFLYTCSLTLLLPWCYAVLWSAIFTTLHTMFNLLSGTRRLWTSNRINRQKLALVWMYCDVEYFCPPSSDYWINSLLSVGFLQTERSLTLVHDTHYTVRTDLTSCLLNHGIYLMNFKNELYPVVMCSAWA